MTRQVLVTGATGFIGRKLVPRLVAHGDRVTVLARNPAKAAALFGASAEIVTELDALPTDAGIDAIVNLAGEPIAGGFWTAKRRALLLASRVETTRALLALSARLRAKPKSWVNGSAIGFYGARAGDEPLAEQSPAGTGFQADLCRQWEETAAGATAHGIHVTALRLGVVLGRDGGALAALARPVRLFAGSVIGSGRQWFSWIHLDDLLALVLFVLDAETLTGPLNATAPNPVRHAELMRALATALHRPLWPLRIPAPVLTVPLGELAELFVAGQRVLPERAQALGFGFRYPTIEAALAEIYAQPARASSSS
jgi:uncharacterized protein (TIGR01777 family)